MDVSARARSRALLALYNTSRARGAVLTPPRAYSTTAMRERRTQTFDDPEDGDDRVEVEHAPGSTAALVASVLAIEKEKAKNKEGGDARATVLPSGADSDDERAVKRGAKRVSFAEDDEDEDALATRAKAASETRALLRSEAAAGVRSTDDRETRAGVEDAEENMEKNDEEEGFTSFNLDKERQEGYFDDEGNYVEYAEEEDETTLWLDKDAKVDERLESGKIRRSTAVLEEEEGARAMSESDIATMQREIASYLNQGETVLGALKRLGGNTKKDGGRGGGRVKQNKVMSDEEKKVFDTLTELSSALMGQGEYEVYTFQKEAFERAAKLYAPTTAPTEDAGAKDMFADSDEDDDALAPEPAPPAKKSKMHEETATPQTSYGDVDFASWSVKNLKTYVESHGGSTNGSMTEKSELVARAKACTKAVVPEGYSWNMEQGLYYCEASDLFFDHSRNLFTDLQRSKWWIYDQAKGFVEWSA